MSCKSIQVQPFNASTSNSNNKPNNFIYEHQNPSSLSQMALNTICKSLRTSVKNLDRTFENVQANSKHVSPVNNISSTSFSVTEDASLSLMLGIMKIKRYILNHLRPDLRSVLLEHALTYSVLCKTVAILRFIIACDIQDLNLHGLDFWITKNKLPAWWEIESKNATNQTIFSNSLANINPPNEFDWYSADQMGRVISFNDVIELLSILKSAKCQAELKTLKINARRDSYASVHKNSDSLFSQLFSGFSSLATLIMRGMADDNLLKIIGNSLTQLKVLDVSYSKFVTDEGIKCLFCNQITALPPLHTLSTWMKQTNLMNSLCKSLYHLDFSYTNVTPESLKFVRCLPGSFIFRRSFALSDKYAFGHVVFVRQKATMSSQILTEDPSFGLKLQKVIGKVAKAQFVTLVRTLQWETKYLNLFRWRSANKNDTSAQDATVGIVTSGGFISGMFKVTNGQIRYVYSDSSFNLNVVGETLILLESIQGIAGGICVSGIVPYFATVTVIDLLAEPCTIYSILKHFLNLVIVKFRVIFEQIVDEDMINSVTSSPCKLTLKEFWVAPGSYKQRLAEGSSKSLHMSEEKSGSSTRLRGTLIGQGGNSEVEQLCKLSVKTANAIFKVCKCLRRLGDLAWWSLVSSEEMALFCRYLQKINASLILTFDDILLPDFELVRD